MASERGTSERILHTGHSSPACLRRRARLTGLHGRDRGLSYNGLTL